MLEANKERWNIMSQLPLQNSEVAFAGWARASAHGIKYFFPPFCSSSGAMMWRYFRRFTSQDEVMRDSELSSMVLNGKIPFFLNAFQTMGSFSKVNVFSTRVVMQPKSTCGFRILIFWRPVCNLALHKSRVRQIMTHAKLAYHTVSDTSI